MWRVSPVHAILILKLHHVLQRPSFNKLPSTSCRRATMMVAQTVMNRAREVAMQLMLGHQTQRRRGSAKTESKHSQTSVTYRSAVKPFHYLVDGTFPADTSVGTGERGMPSCPGLRQRRLSTLRKGRLRRGSSQGASSRASGWQAMPPLDST